MKVAANRAANELVGPRGPRATAHPRPLPAARRHRSTARLKGPGDAADAAEAAATAAVFAAAVAAAIIAAAPPPSPPLPPPLLAALAAASPPWPLIAAPFADAARTANDAASAAEPPPVAAAAASIAAPANDAAVAAVAAADAGRGGDARGCKGPDGVRWWRLPEDIKSKKKRLSVARALILRLVLFVMLLRF